MAEAVKAPAIDPQTLPVRAGAGYPPPFHLPAAGRRKRVAGDALGLGQFGVNLVELPPGAWSSQRHWHSHEDEFVYVIEGELILVSDAGEQRLTAGLCAGFPAGTADGHHLVNRSDRLARYLEVGSRIIGDECSYPDIDLHVRSTPEGNIWTDKQGNRY